MLDGLPFSQEGSTDYSRGLSQVEEECVKEVILEAVDATASQGEHEKEIERENLRCEESMAKLMIDRHVCNQQQTTSSEKEGIEDEVKISLSSTCSIVDTQSLESKGEGLLPNENEDLALSVSGDLARESEAACSFKDFSCYDTCFLDEKLEVKTISSDRQCVVQLLFDVEDDLEMGDSSKPPVHVYEDQERCDSSGLHSLVLASNQDPSSKSDIAESFGILSKNSSGFRVKQCLDVDWHAVNSLCLFLVEGNVLKFGARFYMETVDLGASDLPLLQVFSDQEAIDREGDK